jgi:MoaA/NifB/PqqE/SkfB family radical SAM enzyme
MSERDEITLQPGEPGTFMGETVQTAAGWFAALTLPDGTVEPCGPFETRGEAESALQHALDNVRKMLAATPDVRVEEHAIKYAR